MGCFRLVFSGSLSFTSFHFFSSFSYPFHNFLLSNSGNSVLPSSRSLEELGGWKTCLTSPGADLHKSELQYISHTSWLGMRTVRFPGSWPAEFGGSRGKPGEEEENCQLCDEQSAQVEIECCPWQFDNVLVFSHNIYVYKFILCELLNLVNVFGQMWLMDVFFGGQFTLYGLEVDGEVFLLWIDSLKGGEIDGAEHGREGRPDGKGFPQNDQVHISQVRLWPSKRSSFLFRKPRCIEL